MCVDHAPHKEKEEHLDLRQPKPLTPMMSWVVVEDSSRYGEGTYADADDANHEPMIADCLSRKKKLIFIFKNYIHHPHTPHIKFFFLLPKYCLVYK